MTLSRWLSRGLCWIFCAFLILPILLMLRTALLPAQEAARFSSGKAAMLRQGGMSLEQFRTVLGDRDFLRSYGNSAFLTLASLAFQLPIAILCGFFLSSQRGRLGRDLTKTYIVLMLLPFQAIMLPVYQLSLWLGLYDSHWAVILLNAFAPLGTVAMYLLFRTVEREQWEAALLETSSVTRILAHVLLPQLRTGILLTALLMAVDSWNMVEQPMILLADPRLKPLSLNLNDIYSTSNGSEFAGAALYSLPIWLMFVLGLARLKAGKEEL